MNQHTSFEREPLTPIIEQCVTCENGVLLWRGCHRSRDDMLKQRAEFEGYAGPGYFYPYAKLFVAMIDRVIAEHDDYWREQG